jgi:molecular chaperone GrpE
MTMAERSHSSDDGEKRTAGSPEDQSSSAVGEHQTGSERATGTEHQREELLALLRKTRSDLESCQKRSQRELAEERRFANAALARELLPVVDNLQRALRSASQQHEQGPLVQGVALVLTQLLDALARFGVTPIAPVDEPFDPNLHEAVMVQRRYDVPAGTVVEVLEPGYRLHDRVLRPARVVVGSPPAPSA